MSSQSPGSVLYSSDGYELAVVDGASYIDGTRALIISGINPVGDTVFTPTAEEGALGTTEMSNDFIVQSDVTVSASGSMLVTNNYFGTQEIALIVNVGVGTGSGSFVYTIQEVDPGDGATLMGNSASTVTINSGNTPGVFTAVLNSTTSPMVQVSWTLTGTLSLATVYATVVTKNTPSTQAITGSITATNLSISPVGTAPPADASYMGALANTSAPSMTNGDMYPLSLTTVGALRVDGSAVIQPVDGTGTAGSPAGGVISVQGVPSGTPLDVSIQGLVATGGYIPITGPVDQGSQGTIAESWFMELTDGTNGPVAVKAPNTQAVAADPALVVALSPNSPLPSGSNAIGSVSQNGTWTVQQGGAPWSVVGEGLAGSPTGGVFSVQGVPSGISLNVNIQSVASGALSTVNQGNQGSIGESWFTEITDGVHGPVAVKGPGLAATGTDSSLVVALSPNSPIPAGSNVIGSVNQAGAPWSVVGDGLAGSPTGGIMSVQGVPSGTALNVNIESIATGVLLVTTNKATSSTVTTVAGSTSNTVVLASNPNRIAAAIYNGTNKNMYILLNSGVASTSNFSILLLTGSYWEVPDDYTGAINAVWASGVSNDAYVTEFLP